MTMFFLLFVLPLASALSEPVSENSMETSPSDLETVCPPMLNVTCDEEEILCIGEIGPDGCQREDYCATPSGNCPAICDLDIECEDDEELCQTVDEDGCQIDAPECVPIGSCNDLQCREIPSVECAEGMVKVEGEVDSDGCPMPDYCQCPEPESDPAECADDEMWCDFGIDKNCCWLGAECAKECEASIDNCEVVEVNY